MKACVKFFYSLSVICYTSLATSINLESNDIMDVLRQTPQQGPMHPAECVGNSICAYLQANARGVNVQQLCSCKGLARCSLTWDSEDGRSVTQGSDQYKYCHKAPVLDKCQRGMTAYTSVSLLSKATGAVVKQNDLNRCLCPENSNYDMVDNKFTDVDERLDAIETTYVCNPLRRCESNDACKVVSETTTTFLVNPKCRCGDGTSCPTTAALRGAHHAVETVRFGNGALHMIRCH